MKFYDKIFSHPFLYNFKTRFWYSFFSPIVDFIAKRTWNDKEILTSHCKGDILDVGCGLGFKIPFFKEKLPHYHYFGTDISVGMVTNAKKIYPKLNFIAADATALPFKDKQFSMLLLEGVVHHLPIKLQGKILKECVRVSKKVFINDNVNSNNAFLKALKNFWWHVTDGGYRYPSLKEWHELYEKSNSEIIEEACSSPLPHFYISIIKSRGK